MTTTTTPAKAKAAKPERRTLRFGRLSDLVADVDQFDPTAVQATATWTPGEIVDHVANVIECSIDGFAVSKAPAPVRFFAGFMRGRILNKGLPTGLKIPKNFKFIMPQPGITWADGCTRLRIAVQRLQDGERMEQASPVFGQLSHEQWEQLHCRHAELHFGYLK